MRLDKILPEYLGRVKLVERAYPLEVFNHEPPIRGQLEQEKWLAALQEPLAEFQPFSGDDYPTTTLPAFEAAWCAFQMSAEVGHNYDLQIRRAFFVESLNIGKRSVLMEIAHKIGLDMAYFTQLLDSGYAHQQVLAEGQLGHDRFRVHGTPTIMLSDGTKLRHPIAYPEFKAGQIVKVNSLPCYGESCLDITRGFFEKALQQVAEAH